MDVIINVKQLGRKHAILANKTIEIEDVGVNPSLEKLILAIVEQQVTAYRQRPQDSQLLPVLSKENIDDQAATGKVGFGINYNDRAPDLAKAQENALQAFKDGLFAVFAGEQEIKSLDETVALTPATALTFIRLTFLAGSFW